MNRASFVVGIVLTLTCAAAAPAHAQVEPALAYSALYCDCQNGCNGFCVSPNASRVVTPFTETEGPSDAGQTWSPDGTRVAYVRAGGIVVMDAAGGNAVHLGSATGVAWSPDGQKIAFVSDRDGAPDLYLMNPDGSAVVRVTRQAGVRVTTQVWVTAARPTWSPDSARLAFTCEVDPGNRDICTTKSDGTGFLRLTDDPAGDITPAWSPDGGTIAFATARYGCADCFKLAIMNADGSSVVQLGPGIDGWDPAWSPDGRLIAFGGWGSEALGIHVVNADGSGAGWVADFAAEPAWMPGPALVPRMSVWCSGLVCNFDAWGSIGAITDYSWNFGDDATASGVAVSHTYAEGGSYTIVLSLSGANGITATGRHSVTLNRAPVAAFTVSCESLRCVFDWSGSYDPDTPGYGLNVSWDFGDGPFTCQYVDGVWNRCTHTYAAAGQYTTTLRVYDQDGAAATTSQTLTVVAPSMHVGDLDGKITQQQTTWTATVAITVHDSGHSPLANVPVSASWNDGAAVSCTTDTTGRCLLSKSRIPRKTSVSLTVSNAVDGKHSYTPADNHDPDGDSNGLTITVSRR